MPAAPSLHIRNARIWTADAARPRARELLMVDGRIAAMSERDGAIVAPPGSVMIDARDRVVAPGLIDSHLHLLNGGQSLTEVDLSGAKSRAEFERAIAQAHEQLPAGRWLIARGWSQENWPGHEMPDRSWLSAAGRRPCVGYRMDMHAAVVNEAVLTMCGAMDRTDPQGGRIERDARTKQPTGLMIEAALWQLVNPLVPSLDAGAKRECLLAAQRHAHALGLTMVGSMEYLRDVEQVYRPARDAGELSLRCRITSLDRPLGDEVISFDQPRDFPNDDALAIIGCKTFIDGTLGSRTARMLADYADDAGNRGLLVELTAVGRLHAWIGAVAAAGLSPSMHAIGDEAARLALDAIASLPVHVRQRVRPRVEHAQQIDRADIGRFNRVIASMQPLHKADDARYVERRVGKARTAGTFAFRRLLDAGAILAFGSDWPVVSVDPMLGMRAAITGLTHDGQAVGVDQNLTVEECLHAYTRDAAYCLRMDGDGGAGALREGMLGDCMMFDVDPFAADWVQKPPRVVMTVAGGKVVFDAT